MPADLLYSETERDLSAALGGLLADRAAPADIIARTERPDTYDAALWHTVAAEIGIAGLLIPEALGGAGASYRELAAAAEQFGAAVAPIPYLGSAAVATAVLLSAARSAARDGGGKGRGGKGRCRGRRCRRVRFRLIRSRGGRARRPAARGRAHGERRRGGGNGQHGRLACRGLLRQLADGSLTAVLAVDVGLAPGAPLPGTVRVTGRGGAQGTVKLRGMVGAVADALPAGALLVPGEGVPGALYLVEATAPGVHRTPLVSLDMTRQLCQLSFDDAEARPVAIGEAAQEAVSAGLAAGAVILAAEQLGLAQRCLDMTVAYVKDRRQFARQIGSFQAIKHRLADLWTAIALARAASRYAAACMADGDKDAPVAVALAKAACSDVAVLAAQECVQLHGGIGFTWEHPAHLYLKRAKAASVAFGTPGAHRAALAGLVNLPAPEA